MSGAVEGRKRFEKVRKWQQERQSCRSIWVTSYEKNIISGMLFWNQRGHDSGRPAGSGCGQKGSG